MRSPSDEDGGDTDTAGASDFSGLSLFDSARHVEQRRGNALAAVDVVTAELVATHEFFADSLPACRFFGRGTAAQFRPA